MKRSAVLLCLLGITWIFGVLYIDANMVAMAFVFTVCNGSQVIFVIPFHCHVIVIMEEKKQLPYVAATLSSTDICASLNSFLFLVKIVHCVTTKLGTLLKYDFRRCLCTNSCWGGQKNRKLRKENKRLSP